MYPVFQFDRYDTEANAMWERSTTDQGYVRATCVLIEHSIFGRRTVRLGFWTKSELCSSTLISSGVHDDRTHMGHHFGHHATDAFTHIPHRIQQL